MRLVVWAIEKGLLDLYQTNKNLGFLGEKLNMDPVSVEGTSGFHVVAMPYPGRGHINPMMNLCKLLSSRVDDILITFVVTEEWLGFIGSESKPANIHFISIPNVVPSEKVRAADMHAFIEAILTKMEAPFEQLLDRLEPTATTIIADTFLPWAVDVGNRRNIPVASFWPMSATVFSMFYYVDLLEQNQHFPLDLSERGDERVDYIPGIYSTRIADFPLVMFERGGEMMYRLRPIFPRVSKAQYLLFTSIYELEAHAIDALRAKFLFPIYPIGLAIPYFKLEDINSSITTNPNDLNYLQWLDSQPKSSVLYVSFGSFLSVSSPQMDEIAAGLRDSGVRYLWVARGEISRLKEVCGQMGLLVPWCDQLRVLSHSSIGGLWTHCGWNTTKEGIFVGLPFLTFPVVIDQIPNSKVIVEDWKIGWRVKREVNRDTLVKRKEIAGVVKRFMDLKNDEVKEMRGRARAFQAICRKAIEKDGSSETCLEAFIGNISKCNSY